MLFVAGADGRDAVAVSTGIGIELSTGIAIEDNAVASGVSWAPGSDRLVFAGVTPDGRHDVYVARADGTATTAIGPRTRERVDPAWSPDGQWIAFQGFDPAEQAQVGAYHSRAGLYVMHPDGTGERQLAYGDGGFWQYRRPQWAPDPAVARIATNVGEPGEYDIAVFDVTTGAMTKLTDDLAPDLWPVWSPDGSRIAWLGRRRVRRSPGLTARTSIPSPGWTTTSSGRPTARPCMAGSSVIPPPR